MFLVASVVALLFSIFFYCQALTSGLGRKRWAVAGLVFGPLIWPMFCMKKRMKVNQMFGFNCLVFRA
ncbi:hypothetical protein [Thalassotalea sp. G2M2-11]|uniref:hypothetical protein n=1 Tax=Thalassotalea sp. G2M2-11 TaxID=2787627 RepID=UPI0019D18414|nr:hypothetical protein [Thalassotalea sp. G2M2-11]